MSAPLYGLMAELATSDQLIEAAKLARAEGYRRVEAYAPFPVEGLNEAVGFRSNRVPLITLAGGVAGGTGAYFMQWYSAVVSYPINVGGRPLHSWPSFIAPTFEMTVLGASLAAVLGMLFLNGLPRLRHPVFNVPDFELASRNRFFLCVRTDEAVFNPDGARRFLESLHPLKVIEVPL
jgi:hypothetical protein